MGIHAYLEAAPLNEISRYRESVPQDAVSFTGSPRKHPYEKEKMILVRGQTGRNPLILEFRLSDIINVEEHASEVDVEGDTLYLVTLWVRRGAHAVVHTPFEVGDPNAAF
jgi:hypothetical protein